jgi:hypothetical protein
MHRWMSLTLCSVVLAFVGDSGVAQVTLPGVRLDLPQVALPREVGVDTPLANARIDARRLHVRSLLRAHPDRLMVDPRGELAVRDQVLAQPSTGESLQPLIARGYVVRHETRLAELDLVVAVLEPPPGMSVARALAELRKGDPNGRYDYHHVLSESGEPSATVPGAIAASQRGSVVKPHVRIGMIDGGVAPVSPVLAETAVHAQGCDGRVIPSAHGTAVASLLVDSLRELRSATDTSPVELYADDVYCDEATGGALGAVIEALGWMAGENVSVINVSLVGPANVVLERVVTRMVARGHLIVAAVGNDGPAAPPLYPAAYDGVIAVTGVDRRGRVLLEAGRGPFVDFAALGTDLEAATLTSARAPVRGTSFAAPAVAATLALRTVKLDRAAAEAAVASLAAAAVDLGAKGRDPVYGYGWVKVPSPSSTDGAREVMSHAPATGNL